jgi:hypothetical protein
MSEVFPCAKTNPRNYSRCSSDSASSKQLKLRTFFCRELARILPEGTERNQMWLFGRKPMLQNREILKSCLATPPPQKKLSQDKHELQRRWLDQIPWLRKCKMRHPTSAECFENTRKSDQYTGYTESKIRTRINPHPKIYFEGV